MDQEEDPKSLLESPLIPIPQKGLVVNQEQYTEKWCDVAETVAELKKQLQLAGPLALVGFLQYSVQMISVMFVGHLGQLSLASSSMASSFAGVTGFSVMLGMGSTLETFCGQAYGAKQHHMLGIHLQRAMLVMMLMCIPLSIIWGYTGRIFTIFGQGSEIAAAAGIYARWLIPSLFPYGLLQCQLIFLQTQNITLPLLISSTITALVHIVFCWTMAFRLGLGSVGAALSTGISYWFNVLVLGLYIKFSPACKKTWTGFSKEVVKDLGSFLSLAIPSALMVCLVYWSYEFLVFMSGLLPNPKLETSMMSISLTTSWVVFKVPYGFGSAVSTRVSNELGAGQPRAARLAAIVVIYMAMAEGLLVSVALVAVKEVWGYLYTNEEEVVKYMAVLIPVLATSNFMDGMQAVLSGTLRGCRLQKIGAYVNLGAYYLAGLPSAMILTFVFHFGGKGLWMGIICGSGLQALLLLVVTVNINWDYQAAKARDRVYHSTIPTTIAS